MKLLTYTLFVIALLECSLALGQARGMATGNAQGLRRAIPCAGKRQAATSSPFSTTQQAGRYDRRLRRCG